VLTPFRELGRTRRESWTAIGSLFTTARRPILRRAEHAAPKSLWTVHIMLTCAGS
jgi:hypothetical protein